MNAVNKIHGAFLRRELSLLLKFYASRYPIDQKYIAKELGIDPSNLSRLLNGKYSYGIDIFLAVADRYGLEVKLFSKFE